MPFYIILGNYTYKGLEEIKENGYKLSIHINTYNCSSGLNGS